MPEHVVRLRMEAASDGCHLRFWICLLFEEPKKRSNLAGKPLFTNGRSWPNPAVRKAQCTARVALLASRGFDRHTKPVPVDRSSLRAWQLPFYPGLA
jgi:hypothetical protein